jgi:hypothetical protein
MLEGFMKRQLNKLSDGISEDQKAIGYKVKAGIKSNSYIWSPKFLKLFAEAEYSPNALMENYIVAPDRSENTNAEKLNLQATLLDQTFIPINVFWNYNHGYTSRELSNDIEITGRNLGANLSILNPILPITFSYSNGGWKQTEITQNTSYLYYSDLSSMNINKDFGTFMANRFMLSYEDTKQKYSNYKELNSFITTGTFFNRTNLLTTSDTRLTTNASYQKRLGFQNYLRYDGTSNFSTELPEDFRMNVNYMYSNQTVDSVQNVINKPMLRLEHQLYLSLHSYGYVQFLDSKHTSYSEKMKTFALGFNYEKFIPTGKVYLDYEIRLDKNNRAANPVPLFSKDEEYVLNNASITILRFPNVRESSIIVKNANGTIIYQNNVDYSITNRGNYIQISRIPGGLIDNNSKVYIDYISDIMANSSYSVLSHQIGLKFKLLGNFLEVYDRYSGNNFFEVDTTAFQELQTIDRNIFGFETSFSNFNIGAETENFNTNNLPYYSFRSFLRYRNLIFDVLNFSFEGNMYYYQFKNDGKIQRIVDLVLLSDYPINKWSAATFNGSYRSQNDPSTISNIMSLRLAYIMNIYNAKITGGFELFNRTINKYSNYYTGFFLKLERRF